MDASSLPVFEEWNCELANLASIPEANRPDFYECITDMLERIKRIYPKNTDAEVIAAADAVRVARDAIAALNPKQAAALAHAIELGLWVVDSKAVVYHEMPLTLLQIVEDAFQRLTGRVLYKVAGKRGKPKGSTTANDFGFFVNELLIIVHDRGGRLTFNPKKFDRKKDKGGGTLLDALRCLRPVFPEGLIPEAADLPLKTIGKLWTWERSARRAIAQPQVHSPFNSELEG
jgi:hypothetical protein